MNHIIILLTTLLITQPTTAQWREAWTEHVSDSVFENFRALNQARDVTRLCPNYFDLLYEDRIAVWRELFIQIAYYESGWNPTARFHESTMGTDPITKEPVYSEGLLMLSYQDVIPYPFCEFDWSKDKLLPRNSPKKTILQPKLNLECGIKIMAKMTQNGGLAIPKRGRCYWAVFCDGHKHSRVKQILEKINGWCTPSEGE